MCKSLCLLMIGFISVAEATVPPIPKGIFSAPAAEANGFPDQILNDRRIVGLDIIDEWANVEATEGVYDWSFMDSELAKAAAHGKKVLFGILAGGINVPDWLLADYPDIQTFSFIDPNPYSPTYGQELTMPVYWDPTFLAKKIALIQAAGTHFAANPNIVVVGCAFTNSTTEDWGIPNSPQDIANWQRAGYTTDLMVNAGQTIIDATMAAFPNQWVTTGIGRGAGDLIQPQITWRKRSSITRQRRMGDSLLQSTHSLQTPRIRPLILLLYLTGRCFSINARMWLLKCCGR